MKSKRAIRRTHNIYITTRCTFLYVPVMYVYTQNIHVRIHVYNSENSTALFIWRTTLSKRHPDRKFHAMFVSLHPPPGNHRRALDHVRVYNNVRRPFDRELSKSCINHPDGFVRAPETFLCVSARARGRKLIPRSCTFFGHNGTYFIRARRTVLPREERDGTRGVPPGFARNRALRIRGEGTIREGGGSQSRWRCRKDV